MTRPTPGATIVLDALDLDRTQAFWAQLLGFEAVETERAGSLLERRRLVSPEVAAAHIVIQRCDPRPPIGSCVGSLRRIELHVADPAGAAARVPDPVWIEPPTDDPAARITLRDPNGYHVALVAASSPG
jgi:catechol 2,3-dioxygenase-like lactoylglutathione lyase family enzyme